jgi:hypothetical protein
MHPHHPLPLLAACLLLGALASSASAAVQEPADPAWITAARGTMAEVRVERRIYAQTGSATFMLRFRIVNRGPGTLWADCSSGSDVHPQQWGAIATAARGIVDETRAPRPTLDAAARKALVARIAGGGLAAIPSGGSLDLYREFDGGAGSGRIERATGPSVFVSTAGGCLVSDGTKVEDLSLEGEGFESHDVVVPAPVVPTLVAPLPAAPPKQAATPLAP